MYLLLRTENCLIGAINAANGEANKIQNLETGEWGAVPAVATYYREKGVKWVVIGSFLLGVYQERTAVLIPSVQAITTTAKAHLVSTLLSNPVSLVDWPSSPAHSPESTKPT
jgi:hypothetical protein